jgi:hypothetical protein
MTAAKYAKRGLDERYDSDAQMRRSAPPQREQREVGGIDAVYRRPPNATRHVLDGSVLWIR